MSSTKFEEFNSMQARNEELPYQFTTLPNVVIQNIQYKDFVAFGLWSYFRSLPRTWQVNPTHIKKKLGLSRDIYNRSMKWLEARNLIKRMPLRNENGQYHGYELVICNGVNFIANAPENDPEITESKPHKSESLPKIEKLQTVDLHDNSTVDVIPVGGNSDPFRKDLDLRKERSKKKLKQKDLSSLEIPKTDSSPVAAAEATGLISSFSICEIFKHWQLKLNHPKSKLDAKRKALLRKALKLGYELDELKQAIDGCAASAWHMGQNEEGKVYDELRLIFRDADHIESFMKIATANNPSQGGMTARELQKWIEND